MIYARTGMSGHNVESWQKNMNSVRKLIGFTTPLTVDGKFGPNTLKATLLTQRVIGVKADGIVGSQTISAFSRKFPYVSSGMLAPTHKDMTAFNVESKARIARTLPPKRVFIKRSSWVPKPKPPVILEEPKTTMMPLVIGAGAIFAMMKLG